MGIVRSGVGVCGCVWVCVGVGVGVCVSQLVQKLSQ